MAHNVEFKSIREVDLTALEFPQVAVFYRPKDYPKKSIGRIMDNGKDTNMVVVNDDLVELRRDIRKYTNLVFAFRGKDDVPDLVGVFF